MKTTGEWKEHLKDYPDSKTLTLELLDWNFTRQFIESVQRDALSSPMADTTAQQEFEMTKGQCEKLEMDVEYWKAEVERMRVKWHEARRYLRAANKGAQRNAEALALCQNRYWEMISSDKRWKERDINNHKTIVWNWLVRSDQDLTDKIGRSVTPEQLMVCREMLKAMLDTSLLKRI